MSVYNLGQIVKLKSYSEKSITVVEKLKLIAERIFQKRPLLFEVLRQKGDSPILEYIRGQQQYNPQEIYKERKPELLEVLYAQTKKVLGKKAAEGIPTRMSGVNFVPTTDHHGPLSHPFFASSNVVLALAATKSNSRDQDKQWLLTLDSSSVSLNNSSYPRGLLLHARDSGGALREQHIPLMPKRKRMAAVYAVSPFSEQDIIRAKELVRKKIKRNEITEDIGDRLLSILESVYMKDEVLNSQSYSDQISKTNYYLWKQLQWFQNTEMIHLDLERLTAVLLLRHHIQNLNSPIARLLFDEKSRKSGIEIFDNIIGSYSLRQNTGTMFFWLIEKERRQRLMIRDNSLVSPVGTAVTSLTPEGIGAGLHEGWLMPNMLLDFLILAGYYGMSCFGGFSQVDYLTVMMERWRKFLRAVGEDEEAKMNISVPTKTLYGDIGLVFVAGEDERSEKLAPASFLDILLYGQGKKLEEIAEKARSVNLVESIILNFPELYRILYSKTEKESRLMNITQQEIVDSLHGREKMFVLDIKQR